MKWFFILIDGQQRFQIVSRLYKLVRKRVLNKPPPFICVAKQQSRFCCSIVIFFFNYIDYIAAVIETNYHEAVATHWANIPNDKEYFYSLSNSSHMALAIDNVDHGLFLSHLPCVFFFVSRQHHHYDSEQS